MTRRLRAGLLVAAIVLGACREADIGGPDTTSTTVVATTTDPTSTTEPTPTEPTTTLPPFAVAPIAWTDCSGGQCATVTVPLDHDRPDGPTIDLAVFRQPATGDRLGALFVNFGGPGAGAISILRTFPIPDAVRARFDIVAMDPRGVAGSTPLDCGLDAETLYAADPTIEDAADAEALIEVSQRYVDDCATARADLLPHLGTRDVARDMDLVRAAMGDDTLNYLGFSYGTSIGQVYAELFPDRVRAMVLDGVVDTAATGIEGAAEQARGFEVALGRWAAGCGSRSSCTFDDPLGAVDAMLAAAEGEVPSSGGLRPLGPGEAAIGLALPLYNVRLWGRLDDAVAAAVAGDGAGMVRLADTYLRIVDFSIYFAVNCLDDAWPATPAELFADAKEVASVAPRLGEAITTDYLRCVLWPVPPEPLGPVTALGAPPILVVSGTGDPATPYENGVRVADRLASGVLLTYDGEGHTITFQGSACVDAVVGDYLVALTVPAEGARC